MENSIEEDIKILENLKTAIDTGCVNFSGKSMYGCGYQEALEHILSDYKRVLKENEELKNDYENLSNSVVVKNHYIKNSIPIQKVKDLIEELKENGYWNYLEERDLETTIEILKKLLESEEQMNEEEKEAIKRFKYCSGNFVLDKESAKTILNLIEKLQKENEELRGKILSEG